MKKRLKPIPIQTNVVIDKKNRKTGIFMEMLLLLAGLLSYLFCNTTALDMNIPAAIVVLIGAVSFGLMILLVWYKRVFFSVLGGIGLLSLIFYKLSFPLYKTLFRALEICYNYTVYLLASQPNYSNYTDHLTMDISPYLENTMLLERNFYTALILLALIVSVFFVLAFFRRLPVIVPFLVAMLAQIPFFLYGIVPHYAAFSVFLAALVGCYGQSLVQYIGSYRRKGQKAKKVKGKKSKKTTAQRLEFAANSGSFGVVVGTIILVIAVGTAAFIYTRPIVQMQQVRETIDMAAEDAMNMLFRSTYEKNLNVAGYLADGENLSLNVPHYRRLKVATVETTTATPLYLRYRTTVNLSPDGWTIPDAEFLEKLNETVTPEFTEYNLFYNYLSLTAPSGDPFKAELDAVESEEEGYIKDEIYVNPKYVASDIIGIPNGAATVEPETKTKGIQKLGDTILTHRDSKNRPYTYTSTSQALSSKLFLGKFANTQKEYIKLRSKNAGNNIYFRNELNYSEFVKENYTSLPAKVGNMVQPLAKEITKGYSGKLEKAQAVERDLFENYTYSLQKVNLYREDGSEADAYDQLNYFLFQNEKKEGFCTLFASSMVSMLRSIGIPSRVVTGYYAVPSYVANDEYFTELQDKNYHAWVEVYFDGLGWLRFEPTPGYGMERNYYLLDLADQGLTPDFDTEVEIIYEELEGIILYNLPLPEPTIIEEEKPIVPPLLNFLGMNQPNAFDILLYRLLMVILAIAALFGAMFGIHKYYLARLRKLKPAESVRAAYYMMLRLMQMRGFKFFEGELLESFARRADNLQLTPRPLMPMVPLFQKALYSEQEMDEQERELAASFVETLDKELFKHCNPFKEVWFKFTLGWKPRHKSMIWKFE